MQAQGGIRGRHAPQFSVTSGRQVGLAKLLFLNVLLFSPCLCISVVKGLLACRQQTRISAPSRCYNQGLRSCPRNA